MPSRDRPASHAGDVRSLGSDRLEVGRPVEVVMIDGREASKLGAIRANVLRMENSRRR